MNPVTFFEGVLAGVALTGVVLFLALMVLTRGINRTGRISRLDDNDE